MRTMIPQNTISLRNNSLPTEINALIAAVEEARPTTYAKIEEIAKAAVNRGDISQDLYDRFCPEAESDGSVIFHASNVSSTNYDIRFHYDDTDKTWVATVKPCSDPTTHVPDSKAQPHLALRNCWSGNGQRYLLFRGLVTKVNYAQELNFTGAPAAFAKFYNLTDADLAKWPATQIANNTFMTTALAKDGVLDLSMLPNTVTEIGGYAFGRYDKYGQRQFHQYGAPAEKYDHHKDHQQGRVQQCKLCGYHQGLSDGRGLYCEDQERWLHVHQYDHLRWR